MGPDEAREYADRIIAQREQMREDRAERRAHHRGILGLLLALPASALTRVGG